ncbi:MAG: hypothetical protein KJZ93_04820 [Caldilineaceae bacterium]|nr:hypothetical protein [Caldilineaceae bacterium]
MADIARLYELQKVDTTWEKVRRRLLQLRKLLVESEELLAQRQAVANIEAEQKHLLIVQRDAEQEAQMLADRIRDSESRLMSGQVRNPKELASLQDSIEALRRQREGVETTGVEALLQNEEVTAKLAQARAALEQIEAEWKASQGALLQEETKLKKLFVQCKRQRETLAGVLNRDLLLSYEDLRQRKAGVAVASIERNMCTACHVQVPTGVASAAHNQSGNLVLCPSCGRILYVS